MDQRPKCKAGQDMVSRNHRQNTLWHKLYSFSITKLSILKQHKFLISQSYRSEARVTGAAFSVPGFPALKPSCEPPRFCRKALGRICFEARSGCWQNLFLYGCSVEVPLPCWLYSSGPCLWVPATRSQQDCTASFLCLETLSLLQYLSLCLFFRPSSDSSLRKFSAWTLWSHWSHTDNSG